MATQPDPPPEPAGPTTPAFYALSGGGWRDWWTILHPPYTLWHLSSVALGAAMAPRIAPDRLGASLLAFFLAVGLGAHALDEMHGRPLGTRIPAGQLRAVAWFCLGAAVGLGLVGAAEVGLSLLPFVAFGAFIVWAYNSEAFGGRFHSDAWFALAWGAFPPATGFWAQHPSAEPELILISGACLGLAVAQRALSTSVRALRRRTRSVTGRIERADGSVTPVDRATLTAAPERALQALSIAMVLLAAAAVTARLANG